MPLQRPPSTGRKRRETLDVREKLVELLRNSPHLDTVKGYKGNDCTFEQGADWLIAHGVTVQECGQ